MRKEIPELMLSYCYATAIDVIRDAICLCIPAFSGKKGRILPRSTSDICAVLTVTAVNVKVKKKVGEDKVFRNGCITILVGHCVPPRTVAYQVQKEVFEFWMKVREMRVREPGTPGNLRVPSRTAADLSAILPMSKSPSYSTLRGNGVVQLFKKLFQAFL